MYLVYVGDDRDHAVEVTADGVRQVVSAGQHGFGQHLPDAVGEEVLSAEPDLWQQTTPLAGA